uniref:NADH dehydrogenase subunit 4L n=1 Tax=Megalophaedusa gracilispira TaxID=1885865 RepID=A0A224AB49_9EUPU|nr:NADH dehydrogenase subunit 4L [Megalophaedusa gracilispira]
MFFIFVLFAFVMMLLLLFFSTTTYYLKALLVLEALVLSSLVLSLFLMHAYGGPLFLFMLLLTLGVCEAGLGLSLLFCVLKVKSSDFVGSI